MSNIIEFIDSLLPQDRIPIFYLSIPDKTDGLLIEETGIRGQVNSFAGYKGVISSTIQLYVRCEPTSNKYKEINALLKEFYKIISSNKGLEKDGIKLLYVDQFNLTTNMRDERHNYIFSLMFSVIYKEME